MDLRPFYFDVANFNDLQGLDSSSKSFMES